MWGEATIARNGRGLKSCPECSVPARTSGCVRLYESSSRSGQGRVVFPLATQQQPTLRARRIAQDVVKFDAPARYLVFPPQGLDLVLELRFDLVCGPRLKHCLIHPAEGTFFAAAPHPDAFLVQFPGPNGDLFWPFAEHISFYQRRAGVSAVIRSRVLRTWGESESGLAEMLQDRIEALDRAGNPTLAFQASGIEGLKIRITGEDR